MAKYFSLTRASTSLLATDLLPAGRDPFKPDRILRLLFLRRPMSQLCILALGALSTAVALVSPYFQKVFLDALLGHASPQMMPPGSSLAWLIVMAFAASVTASVLLSLCRLLCARESALANRWLAQQLYEHTLNLDVRARGRNTVGQTVALFAQDVASVCAILDDLLPNLLASLIPLIAAPLAIQIMFDLPLWPILVSSAFFTGVCLLLSLRQSSFIAAAKINTEQRLSVVNEWLQNMRALRILGWVEEFEKRIFAARKEESRNRVSTVTNGSTMNSIAQVAPQLINLVGILTLLHWRNGKVTPGEIFALLWVFGVFLIRPIRMLPWTLVVALDGHTSAVRLGRFLALEREVQGGFNQKGETHTAPGLGLCVRDLCLNLDGQNVLKGVTFSIKPGEFVAVVGEVGSGKTLLLHSLLREVPARFGHYAIGDENGTELSLVSLRALFSYVPQDGFVMSSTLRDNVNFNYDASRQFDPLVNDALALADFNTAVERIEHGLETEIGERGVNLSGGQRQRVSLARSHFFDRPVMLLDDCLSAVDIDTERKINANLLCGRWKNKTRLLVTHRLSILHHCDRILYMEDGQIVEQGTYTGLLATSESFKRYVASLEAEPCRPKERV